MRQSLGLIPKILTGEKTIESRWYHNKSRPWDRIKPGEIIYFKNAGQPVVAAAEVEKVLSYSNLKPDEIRERLARYREAIGLAKDFEEYYRSIKNKRYGLLIFLKNARRVDRFEISKLGFGSMAAWMTVDDITRVKRFKD